MNISNSSKRIFVSFKQTLKIKAQIIFVSFSFSFSQLNIQTRAMIEYSSGILSSSLFVEPAKERAVCFKYF